jgi:hypothetical protein
VVRLVWSNDLESYAGSSVATGIGPPMLDWLKIMTLTKRDTLILQVGGCGMRLRTSPP